MSEAKFTKGEWVAKNGVVRMSNKGGIDVSGAPDYIANAHLIAAAPEMYGAIKHVLEMQLRGYIVLGDEATGKLQKSLAKARGE